MKNLFSNIILLSSFLILKDNNCFGQPAKTGAVKSLKVSNVQKGINISNKTLTVTYVEHSKTIELKYNTTGHIFSTVPVAENTVLQASKVSNSIFGAGSIITISDKNGRQITYALYKDQPFVFVSQTIPNVTTDTIEINKLKITPFNIDLNTSTSSIKTLGTGGLLAPDKNPGSYVFLTTVAPESRNGVVAGWLTHEKGDGVFFSGINNGKVFIQPQIDYGRYLLVPKSNPVSETMVIGYFEDARIGEELFADAIAKNYNIKLPARSAVYCTWYAEKNGGAGSEPSTIKLADYVSKNLKQFGLGTIQIDDMWQDGGTYNGPRRGFDRVDPKGLYPNGMSTTATAIKNAGLTAGIWWMPFGRNHQDPEYANRQDWFVRKPNDSIFETKWGGSALDLTHPAVKKHIAEISKSMQNWGYGYFKMDGIWMGTGTPIMYINDGYKDDKMGDIKLLHNPMVTQIEAFRSGVKEIAQVTHGNVFLSACCQSQNMRSFGASIGLVHSMRIGPDLNHDGMGIRTGPLRASRLYFLNKRVWYNDPDPCILREKGSAGADASTTGVGSIGKTRILPSFVGITSQLYLSSDWLPDLPAERTEIMKRCMAYHNGIARPVDAFDRDLPAIWLASDNKTGTERNVVGLFNWINRDTAVATSLKKAGLNSSAGYYAFDFWENKPFEFLKSTVSANLKGETCKILAIREKSNHPVIVSTSQHITQGMIDLLQEKWSNNSIIATSNLIGGDDYEVRITGLKDGGNWAPANATLLNGSSDDSIQLLPPAEDGWVRVLIKSKNTKKLQWQIQFKKS